MTPLRLSLLAIAFVMASLPALAADRPPNIVFILADDLGYGDVGCYGQQKIRTPNIDKLASQGIRFTQCYAGSTVCAPSRCSLMTGYHTGHAYIRGNANVYLRPTDVTVAKLLHEKGYVTANMGKWGLGDPGTTGVPSKQGFDYFFGYMNQTHAHNYFPDHLWRHEEKVPLKNVQEKGVASKRVEYAPDLIQAETLKFLDANHTKPFFLYYAPTFPHANNEKNRADGNGNEIPSDAPYTNEKWPIQEKNKAAMITRLDTDIGQILTKLTELKLDNNTVVIFTSDNGPHREGGNDPQFFQSSGPFRGIKRSLTDGGVRVPGIVRYPGVAKPGTVSDHIWAFWDFLPTACELAGAKAPDGIDGISFAPTITGKGMQKEHEFLYWEFHEGGTTQGVRYGKWKGIRSAPGKPLQLYDITTDLKEMTNVADKNPDVVAKIENYLKTARTDSKEFPIVEPKAPKTPKKK